DRRDHGRLGTAAGVGWQGQSSAHVETAGSPFGHNDDGKGRVMKRCHTEDRGDYRVVVLSGEVDLSWSQQVRREVLDALKAGDRVAVDLSAVSYLDSSGIAA